MSYGINGTEDVGKVKKVREKNEGEEEA